MATNFSLDSKTLKNLFRWFVRILIYVNILFFLVPFFDLPINERYEIGKFLGVVAAIVFVITDLPGILRRFKATGILKQIQNNLMYSRAHLGSLMFLLALNHYILTYLVDIIQFGFATPKLFQLFGIVALYGTFPLFLTSNQWAKKKMKKWWGRLHKLVYVLIWAIFIHVALVGNLWISAMLLITGAIQVMSLVYASLETKNKKQSLNQA